MGEKPLSSEEFQTLMEALGPFERHPTIAVAVSGGADSTALAILLGSWARRVGGQTVALIVDHGLRNESAAETHKVTQALNLLGLDHHVLYWRNAKPKANVQAAARTARYELLIGWCIAHNVLHLALAHHLDDQTETFLLRLGRGSGLEGLAGMAPVQMRSDVRLLRPLLSIPKRRLVATLESLGIGWLEDPSNRDRAHARARIRRLLPTLSAEGLHTRRLAFTAGRLGWARDAIDQAVARILAQSAALHPAGFVELDPAPLAAAPGEVALRALSRLLMTVGGSDYGPRLVRLQRLYGRLAHGLRRGVTLGGCRILPRRACWLVVRETASVPSVELKPAARLLWDGRFEIALSREQGAKHDRLLLGPLGKTGWAEVAAGGAEVRATRIPWAARGALPAIRDHRGVLHVPHVSYRRAGAPALSLGRCRFAPRSQLTSGWFTVA